MKILYFVTICNYDTYEKIIEKCKIKPTIATVVFETALLKGFYQNGVKVEVASYPMIPNYRYSKIFCFGGKSEKLECGYGAYWLKTWNILFLKQLSRRIDGRRVLKKWLKKNNKEECVVMSYGIAPFLAKDIVRLSQKFGVKNCAIVPDLPKDMFMNSPKHFLKSGLRNLYLKPTLAVQGDFDSYVYLTKAMAEVINPKKPFVVVEGLLDNFSKTGIKEVKKSIPRGIMYAGSLHEKFGILNLIDAFEIADISNVELWLFGDGNAIDKIRKRESQNPNIKLFGRVDRETVIEYEKRATLLVNPRSIKDEFTKYSFPSKTIEYMYSGTPLLTTRLQGIPEEYFKYVFSIADNEVDLLSATLKEVLSLPETTLFEIGEKAKRYIVEQKNAKSQCERIIEFLEGNG